MPNQNGRASWSVVSCSSPFSCVLLRFARLLVQNTINNSKHQLGDVWVGCPCAHTSPTKRGNTSHPGPSTPTCASCGRDPITSQTIWHKQCNEPCSTILLKQLPLRNDGKRLQSDRGIHSDTANSISLTHTFPGHQLLRLNNRFNYIAFTTGSIWLVCRRSRTNY